MSRPYLIIAGSEKCGTTSLFQYLADSGSFIVSREKETDYFRREGDLSINEYLNNFDNINNSLPIAYMEASPGYLSDSHISATNIAKTLDNYNLVFCLRNPLERLISSFLFHKSRLYIPKDMSFDIYFQECLKFEKGEGYDERLSEWCLRVPDCGKYWKHLQDFIKHVPQDKILVFSFDEFKDKPKLVVSKILAQYKLDADFYNDYDFKKSNATFSHKNDAMQFLALKLNKLLEGFWVKKPHIKEILLGFYKKINSKNKEKVEISSEVRKLLYDYYINDLESLKKSDLINDNTILSWVSRIENA